MIRLAANRSFRLVIALALIFCLVYGPVYSLNPARAESSPLGAPPTKPAAPQQITKAHKRGEVIIKFKDDTPKQVRDQIVQTYAKNEKELRGRGKASKLTIKDGFDLANTIFDLKQFTSIVEFAEPNYIVTGAGDLKVASRRVKRSRGSAQSPTTPNDPQFNQQWALANTGQGGGLPGSDIGAVAGWQKTTGSRDAIIAVIDTGIDVYHPDLADNLWINKREANGRKHEDDDRDGYVDDINGWNFVSDNDNINDDHGHGTAMAGIIAAEGDNRAGIAGVMWQASVMPLKALDSTGSGAISDVVEAIDYAADHGASVINCSFGTEVFSQALLDAINRASMSGALVVASAGNNGWDLSQTPYYPASYTASNLITVAATTNNDLLAAFSNFGGPTQIAAPGIDVLTTYPNRRYVTVTGTSAAAPLVSGVAGLLKTIRGWVSAQSVRKAIIDGARVVPMLNGRVTSSGVVSAGEAVAVFTQNNNGGGNGGGGNGGGGGGNGGGGNGGGGGGGNGGGAGNQPTGMNLDFMRDNRPNLPEPRVRINLVVPDSPYNDPEPGTSGLGGYFAQESLSKNSVGRAGAKAGEDGDPTSTGQTSINLGSQNVNFVAPVVSLDGRGGLGVNLALSYNSNVWVKNGSGIAYNTDKDVAGVGWSIGFGSIQGIPSGSSIEPFGDSISSKNAYLYITPDGGRRTLVQVGTSDIYTSYDSSYIEFNKTTKVLRLMNGTQIHFITPTYSGSAIGKRLLPDKITDRNGNYIAISNAEILNENFVNGQRVANDSHDWGIDYIIDTLGRKIDFYYESNLLRKVRQDRGGGTWFDYVVISYAPISISTNFITGLTPDPSNISTAQVWQPWYIEYPTQHTTRIFYTSYGQMYEIEKWVPTVAGQGASRPVAFTRYDMQSVGGYSAPGGALTGPGVNTAQTDCPKFSLRQEWAEYWSPASTQTNPAPDIPGWNKLLSGGWTYYVAQYSYEFNIAGNYTKVIDPKDRVFRTDVSADGLTHTSKTYASQAAYNGGSGTPLKTIIITFDKDTGLGYTSNLRVTDVRLQDGANTRRTGYTYTTVNGATLPNDVTEYNSDASSVYRHSVTTYNPDTNYGNRHILGLPSGVQTYSGAGTGNLVRSIAFTYDEGSYFDATSYTATNHDAANYGTGFTWRANLTTVTQYQVPGGASRAISHTRYDMTGVVRAVYDGANNATQFFYDDNFVTNPGVGQTHALVTKAQSPAYSINGGAQGSSWSGAKYNYYTGSVAQSYHIAGTSGTGAQENIVNYAYFSDGRLYSITQPTGGQLTRDYWDNWRAVATYTKIDAANTRYDFVAYDGAGQTRYNGGDHPDRDVSVTGKYWIQTFAYDSVGRTTSASNLTAVDGAYSPNHPEWDEDYYFGWLYTTTAYDALDRPTLVTRPDAHAVQYSYTGCGCAGSSTVTTTDERGKQRKVVYDFLGRLSEAYNLTSAGATYSRAAYSYDTRDLLTAVAHYNSGSAHQDRTFAYDGYERLQSQTTPEAGTVSYLYWANDLVQRATDARGVYAQFTYNPAGMLTDVDYSDTTPDVHYNYGEYGERLLMQEKNSGGTEIARTNYSYDSYKRLQTETRVFNGLSGTFSVGYEYNYVDAPTRLTYTVNSWTKNVNYAYKTSGALSSVGTNLTGSDPNANSNVASGFDYRAFAALQSVNYGNGRKLNAGYNQKRSQMTSLQVKKNDGTDAIINLSYDYYSGGGGSNGNNGRIRHIDDLTDGFSTADFGYDDHNRLTTYGYGPNYPRSYTHDEWGNLRSVSSGTGGGEAPNYTLSYANNASGAPATNRIANTGYTFDNAGNMTNDGSQSFSYDAASRLKTASWNTSSYEYDGDGNRVKQANSSGTIHYLWSSVLGEPVAELTSGGVYRAYVYGPGGGQMIAMQSYDGGFYWLHTDHLGTGRKITDSSGTVVYRGEFDPHGQVLYEWASGGATFLNSHKFTGYERDWATNLNYAKARTYNHNRGRFMQPDPLGLGAADLTNPQSLNRYSYVGNDPANFVDPTGLMLAMVCWSVDWYGWNDKGESVTGSTEVCAIIDIGGGGWGPFTPHDPVVSGGGQENPQLPIGELPPQEEVIDPCVSRLSRILTDINLARTGLNQFIESKSASANGLGYVVRFKDPRAARNYLEANFDRLPGIFGGVGTAYHRKELQSSFPAATGGFTDFRGKNDPSSGTRSLQVVTYGPGAFVDTDRYNPYQGLGGFFGHLFKEVIGRRGTVDIEKLCK